MWDWHLDLHQPIVETQQQEELLFKEKLIAKRHMQLCPVWSYNLTAKLSSVFAEVCSPRFHHSQKVFRNFMSFAPGHPRLHVVNQQGTQCLACRDTHSAAMGLENLVMIWTRSFQRTKQPPRQPFWSTVEVKNVNMSKTLIKLEVLTVSFLWVWTCWSSSCVTFEAAAIQGKRITSKPTSSWRMFALGMGSVHGAGS